MSILQLIADIPTNANLRLQISNLEKENLVLKSENSVLKSQLEDAKMEIKKLKKVPNPSQNICWQGHPASRSSNMI